MSLEEILKMKINQCKRCEHEWVNRRVRRVYKHPVACPKCHSKHWESERTPEEQARLERMRRGERRVKHRLPKIELPAEFYAMTPGGSVMVYWDTYSMLDRHNVRCKRYSKAINNAAALLGWQVVRVSNPEGIRVLRVS